MFKRLLFLALFTLTACASFERRLADDMVAAGKVELNRCEIEGFDFSGIDSSLGAGKVLKLLMIHGVGTHHPGYSRQLQQNLADNIGLDVLSQHYKDINLLDPVDKKTPIGVLRVTFWQNREQTKNLLFYELTWSEITTPYKKIIAFDTTEQYTKFRVPFNNMMKEFLDNTLPDPLVYVVDKHDLIIHSGEQAICWMINTNWNNIPAGRTKVCEMSLQQEIDGLADNNALFITHSLGSKIIMDSLTRIADRIASHDASPSFSQSLQKLRQKELTVFMLANQLPILQIAHPLPTVHSQIPAYCTPGGSHYRQRVFKHINIVAFSDPNDLLSYAIPQNFADKYIDSRMCPLVTNASVNVAPEISAFGVGIVNPVTAHTGYDKSPKVINLITHGTDDFDNSQILREQCRFIKLKPDSEMTWIKR